MDDDRIREVWETEVRRHVFADAHPSEHTVTVFLGGQPAAGKTSGQDLAKMLHPDILPIIGDDYRRFHDDYDRLMRDEPLHMPEETAHASGMWVGLCVEYADENNISTLIEGTWRNADTVLREAENSKKHNRETHAIIMATPPLISRAGMLDRYASNVLIGRAARWTPPTAHDQTVEALRDTVPVIANSPLIDRFSVTDRSGELLFDATDASKTEGAAVWRRTFDRPITFAEINELRQVLNRAKDAVETLNPQDAEQVNDVIEELSRSISRALRTAAAPIIAASDQQNGRWQQNRDSCGRFSHGGHRIG